MARARAASLLVVPALFAACGDGGIAPPACDMETRLLPGEVLATDPTSNEPGCGLLLPAGAPGTRYRVALVRPDSAGASATTTVTLHVEGLGVTPDGAASAPGALPAPEGSAGGAVLPVPDGARAAAARFHEALRREEAEMVGRIGTAGLLASRGATLLEAAPAAAPSPAKLQFDTGTTCTATRSPRTAVLLGENDVLAIYQDSVEAPIAATHVQRMLSFYAAYGKETVETYFGSLPDVDANGKVFVVVTAQAFSSPNTVAFVWAGNFYQRSTCPASDEAEVIYMNPTRIRSMESGEYVALGVLSHEAKHLVSLYHRLARTRRQNSSTFLSHPAWMEEGRAELADEVTSRRAWSVVGGPSPTQAVGLEELRETGLQGNRCCRPEAYGVALEAARTVWYLSSQPNSLALTPQGATAESDIRNGGWHFHRWLGDAYANAHASPAADAGFFRSLTDSLTASGSDGLRAVLGKDFGQLLEEFSAAVMLHGTGAPSAVGAFRTYDFVSLTASILGGGTQPPGRYPWPVTTSGSGDGATPTRSFESASYSGSIGPTGLRIHDFTSNGTGTGALLRVDSPVPVRLVVVRLQ